MHKKTVFILLSYLFITVNLYAKTPKVDDIKVKVDSDRLKITISLKEALDIERMQIIETGKIITLEFYIKIYRKSSFILVPDSQIDIDPNSSKVKEQIVITRTLKYDYIEKLYKCKESNNIGSKNINWNFYSGTTIKKSILYLNKKFFEKPVYIDISLDRLDITKGDTYYIEVYAKFTALKELEFSILNFTTNYYYSNNFKRK